MLDGAIFVTCKNCQAKNRLQVRHLMSSPRCGRCHAALLNDEGTSPAPSLVPRAAAEGDVVARRDTP